MAKTIIGTVSSSKADKTIVVTVQTRKTHPLYRKQYSVSTKFMAHDEKNEAQDGDRVSIIETKPLSKRKRFSLEKIIEKPALRDTDRVDKQIEAPETARVDKQVEASEVVEEKA